MIITLTAEQAALILNTEPSPALAWMQDQWRELLEQVLFGEPGVDEETGEHHWADIRLTPFDLYLAEIAKAGADWVLTDPEERTPLVPYQAAIDWRILDQLCACETGAAARELAVLLGHPEPDGSDPIVIRDQVIAAEFSKQGESLGLPSYAQWLEARQPLEVEEG